MEYEDRTAVATPEGIVLEYTLAGIGSRFIAWFLDLLLKLLVIAAVLVVLIAIKPGVAGLVILGVVTFLVLFGYDIVFEVWAAGRTPGKRWNGLRVVMVGGQPIRFAASAVRNLMRLIDAQPGLLYAVGATSILATHLNQRLGDLAAGAIVLREPAAGAPGAAAGPASEVTPDAVAGVDVTAVSAAELAAVRDFLARRSTLTPAARDRVAARLADGLAAKVGGLPPGGLAPERMLETIAAAKRSSA